MQRQELRRFVLLKEARPHKCKYWSMRHWTLVTAKSKHFKMDMCTGCTWCRCRHRYSWCTLSGRHSTSAWITAYVAYPVLHCYGSRRCGADDWCRYCVLHHVRSCWRLDLINNFWSEVLVWTSIWHWLGNQSPSPFLYGFVWNLSGRQ